MKKVLSILFAGLLALGSVSCVKEQLATFDLSHSTAPVIGQVEQSEKAITVSFQPAVFNVGFNQQMPVNYSLILTSINENPVNLKVPASIKDNVATISVAALSKMLIAQGLSEGTTANLEIILRALMQGASEDVSGGALDAQQYISIPGYEIIIPASNPWVGFDDVSAWSLIGAIESVGMNWNDDIVMYTNGSQHVAKAVKLSTSDQFKFRKDKAWGENFGADGDVEPFVVSLDTAYPAKGGGKNLAVPTDGVYDLLLDTDAETFTISEAYITYPGFDESSPWSVIGAIASFEMNWDKDIAMITDGEWHVAEGVTLTTSDQFKFRKDQAWGENFGAEGNDEPFVVTLDTEYPASAGGKNLGVPADGIYDLLVNPEAKLFKVVETLGGKSGLIGGDEPEPEPAYQGWGIIGDFNGWAADAVMTQVAPGIWISDELELTDGGWKLRYNSDWDINRGGGALTQQGEFTAAYPNGDNLTLAGKMRVVFNENNQTIGTLGWGVVGKIESIEGFNWNNDVPMNLAPDGKWYSVPVKLSETDEIKIRYMAAWDDDRGGDAVAADEAFAVTKGGHNIKAPKAGTYMLVYDPTAETITLSTNFWSLIGEFSSWAGDHFMLPAGDGKWYAYNQSISGGWKIRKGADWTVSAGGNYAAAGEAFDAVTENGPNIAVTDMTRFDVVYDTAAGKITVSKPVK